MTGIIARSVGSHSTLSGGTRTSAKTVRPWQVRLEVPANRADCMLCTRPQLDEHYPADGWKTFGNSNTPWQYHRLLTPTDCWPIDKLWLLGGPGTLATALELAINDVIRSRGHLFPIWIFTHIGYGAGQNFAHHHWHICEPAPKPKRLELDGCVDLWGNPSFETVLGGVRAGQAFILPKALYKQELVPELAVESSKLIEKFNDKFNRPDYCLLLAIHNEVEWWVRYTPILNNWGGSEFAALDLNTPFVLPWPHEATAAHLLGEKP